jgi:hypothetical protein
MQPTAVEEVGDRISGEVREGKWKNVRGEIVYVKPF